MSTNSVQLIDTHCHLDVLEQAPLDEIIADAKQAFVTRMICIGASDGIDSATRAIKLAEENEGVWASVGVHPHDAGSFTELKQLSSLVTHPKVVAVGETGLDFFRDWAPQDKQYELFRNSISFAKEYNKPIIIHCRDAAQETLQVLREEGAAAVGGVFHCYSEDETFATELQKINFLVSFTGTVTFKRAEAMREIAKKIPLDQIMVETDAPYMAPEPFRGKPSEPKHVYQIALTLAKAKGISLEEVAAATSANAERLFKLK